jgi:redox-sensitive bicupin YhaK (pirin superfamily)
MGFSRLRVINEDRVAPGGGFPPHGHRDMEIISYVLEGAIEHRDSLGTGAILRPGEVQRMSAGTGVRHSELNPLANEPLHFLQIWIEPERTGLPPEYEQRAFPVEELRGRLRPVVARDGRDGALRIHQDVVMYASKLEPGERVELARTGGRRYWLQVARGGLTLDGHALAAGDGAAISADGPSALDGDGRLRIAATQPGSELLLFDLP